jgi:hypothetical protein
MARLIRAVIIAPRDFEVLAVTRLLKRRPQNWILESPLDARYPVYRFARTNSSITVAICSSDDSAGFEHARRAVYTLCGVDDSRFRPAAFFLCGTLGAARHLHEKDKAQIGDIVLARSALGLSTGTVGTDAKARGMFIKVDFENSLVGRLFVQVADEWSAAIASMLGMTSREFIRTDVASTPLMIKDERLMSGLATAPGTETCEMELAAVAQCLAEKFGSVNTNTGPSLQLVKGISDFVGLGHDDANRRVAADASAAAVVAFLELPAVRAALSDIGTASSVYKAGPVRIQEVLERVADSVRSRTQATQQDWDFLQEYTQLDNAAFEAVLEAVDYACADACSGCGAGMDLVRPVLEGAAPILERYLDARSDVPTTVASVFQHAGALDISRISQWGRRVATAVLQYQPGQREIEDYRELLLALIYIVADDLELADRFAQRSIQLTRQHLPDDKYRALRMGRCRLCILARHSDPRARALADQLLDESERTVLPATEAIEFKLGTELRLFEYKLNVWRRKQRSSSASNRNRKQSPLALLEEGENLRSRLDAAGWDQDNIWYTGLLVAIAELSGNRVDLAAAQSACVRFLGRTGQKRHCMYRIEGWSPSAQN